MTKKRERQREITQMIMPRFSLGVTITDKVRNEHIGWTLKVGRFGQKVRQSMLRWCGQVTQQDDDYVDRKVMVWQFPGKRKCERPKRTYLDVVKVGARENDVFKSRVWRIGCDDACWENRKKK